MIATAPSINKVLRVRHLKDKLAISVASLYNKMNPRSKYYDATFPRPIRLSATHSPRGSIGWLESDVDAWLEIRRCASLKQTGEM